MTNVASRVLRNVIVLGVVFGLGAGIYRITYGSRDQNIPTSAYLEYKPRNRVIDASWNVGGGPHHQEIAHSPFAAGASATAGFTMTFTAVPRGGGESLKITLYVRGRPVIVCPGAGDSPVTCTWIVA